MKPQRERLVTELTTARVTVPRVAIARWRAAMGLMGLGLGTSGVGLAWDFYVHEIARDVGEVESIFATPHLMIFAGIGITALVFLLSLVGVRFRGERSLRPASRMVDTAPSKAPGNALRRSEPMSPSA